MIFLKALWVMQKDYSMISVFQCFSHSDSKFLSEFIMNPSGKSPVCILHEYVQHTLRVQPKYIFKELGKSLCIWLKFILKFIYTFYTFQYNWIYLWFQFICLSVLLSDVYKSQ